MAKYFSKFPKVYYNLNNTNDLNVVTNITARFTIEEKLKDNATSYFNYTILDGDTPEIVAAKLYGSSERHWIILLMNNIIDPQYDWPLQYDTLNRYIANKYSAAEYANTQNTSIPGIIWAQQNTHSYYKRETTITQNESTFVDQQISFQDFTFLAPFTRTYNFSDGTSADLNTSKYTKTYYDYELEENENKRIIKILKTEFVPSIEEEFQSVFL
jgi:hypothetical protein